MPGRREPDRGSPVLNQAWRTDITYRKTAKGWLFLAAILSALSRTVSAKLNAGPMPMRPLSRSSQKPHRRHRDTLARRADPCGA